MPLNPFTSFGRFAGSFGIASGYQLLMINTVVTEEICRICSDPWELWLSFFACNFSMTFVCLPKQAAKLRVNDSTEGPNKKWNQVQLWPQSIMSHSAIQRLPIQFDQKVKGHAVQRSLYDKIKSWDSGVFLTTRWRQRHIWLLYYIKTFKTCIKRNQN